MLSHDGRQRVDVDTGTRMGGHLDRTQLAALKCLERRIEGRRLHRDQVTRLGDHLQAEVERFHRTVRDDDLFGVDAAAHRQIAHGDLPAQFSAAR